MLRKQKAKFISALDPINRLEESSDPAAVNISSTIPQILLSSLSNQLQCEEPSTDQSSVKMLFQRTKFDIQMCNIQ